MTHANGNGRASWFGGGGVGSVDGGAGCRCGLRCAVLRAFCLRVRRTGLTIRQAGLSVGVQQSGEETSGVGVLVARDLLGSSGGDDLTAQVAAFGTQIDEPVRG